VTGDAFDRFLYEFKKINDEPVPQSEMDDAHRAIVANFALSLEQPSQILNDWLTVQYYALPVDYWDKYPDHIGAIDAAAAQASAKKFVDLDHLQWICVGDRKEIESVLKKYGAVSVVDVTAVDRRGGSKPRPYDNRSSDRQVLLIARTMSNKTMAPTVAITSCPISPYAASPSRPNIQPPRIDPTMPTIRSTKIPIPEPFTIFPAKKPARIPMMISQRNPMCAPPQDLSVGPAPQRLLPGRLTGRHSSTNPFRSNTPRPQQRRPQARAASVPGCLRKHRG
jgi:hypothetical protein